VALAAGADAGRLAGGNVARFPHESIRLSAAENDVMNRKVEELIRRVAHRQERVRLWLQLAVCWAVSAAVGLGLGRLRHESVREIPREELGLALVATGVAVFLIWRWRKLRPDYRAVARVIELQHPELNGRLLTAVQQSYGPQAEIGYLQGRLIAEILSQQEPGGWEDVVPSVRLWLAQTAHWAGAALFALALVGLQGHTARSLAASASASGVTITPGDTRLERGSTLVVLAHFDGSLPAFVSLVVGASAGSTNSVPLAKSLADPIFGGTVSEVNSNLVYHIEYDGRRTRDFNVQVFEYPRLERSDVGLSFPEYTGQAAQFTENTRRVTAVEGSLLDLNLHLNKPVMIARLIPKEKGQPLIGLNVNASHPAAALKQFTLEQNGTYDLQLVDAEGLTNKIASQFVFAVQKNHPPEVRLTMPHGDLRPSPLEEVAFEGSVWDDFGVSAYGVGYSVVGEATRFVQLGERVPAKEKRPFHYLLRLEDVGVQPDQLISWFVWADDLGSDGHVRRTNGDLFFGEIRPFDEIFREGQGGDAQQAEQSGESGGEDCTIGGAAEANHFRNLEAANGDYSSLRGGCVDGPRFPGPGVGPGRSRFAPPGVPHRRDLALGLEQHAEGHRPIEPGHQLRGQASECLARRAGGVSIFVEAARA